MQEKSVQEIDKVISEAEELFDKAFTYFYAKNFKTAVDLLLKAHSLFLELKDLDKIAVCMVWEAYFQYIENKNRYLGSLTLLDEAKFLNELSNSDEFLGSYYFVLGHITYKEGEVNDAYPMLYKSVNFAQKCPYLEFNVNLLFAEIYKKNNQKSKSLEFYEKALLYAKEKEITPMIDFIDTQLSSEQNDNIKLSTFNTFDIMGNSFNINNSSKSLFSLLKIGRLIAAETDINILLTTIAEETRIAINADRCTVFLYDEENYELCSKVALGMEEQEIRFPADKGLAGHVLSTGETVNIKNAYKDARFNKDIDQKTGYKTKTILCMPIRNIRHEIVGVFQVINKNGLEFTPEDEDLLVAIGTSAGIALENARLFLKQQQMLQDQKQLFSDFIDTLAMSIDARDKITSGHSKRVNLYSNLICEKLNLEQKQIDIISQAAILHDIGKIGIKDSILQKSGKLSEEEYEHIKQHVKITHDILSKIYYSKELSAITEVASSHHEKFDGSGYYQGLKGEEIPLGGRIIAVSDVFDAITSKRHYRDKMDIKNVIDIIKNGAGSHFDPQIVDIFLNISINKIINVLLSEQNKKVEPEFIDFLSKYTLIDLYDIISNKEQSSLNSEQFEFVKIFNKYYNDRNLSEIINENN